jgi:hypothetical protein
MDLKFSVTELSFLQLYSNCSNSKTSIADKFQFISIKDSTNIICLQNSLNIQLFTILKDKNLDNSEFIVTYEVKKFFDILKHCNTDDEIIITSENILFGKNSNYQFEKYDLDEATNIKNIFSILANVSKYKTIELNSLDKLSKVKSYIGEERLGLHVIGLFNNYFVTSNREDGTIAIITKNDFTKALYFPKELLNLSYLFKDNSTTLILIREFNKYLVYCGETLIFIEAPDLTKVLLPDIFSSDIRAMYNHETTLIFKKELLLKALKKLTGASSQKAESRIYLLFEKDKFILESRTTSICRETIEYSFDINELLSLQIIVSVTQMLSMVLAIQDEEIYLKVPINANAMNTLTVTNKDESTFFIIPLYIGSGTKE